MLSKPLVVATLISTGLLVACGSDSNSSKNKGKNKANASTITCEYNQQREGDLVLHDMGFNSLNREGDAGITRSHSDYVLDVVDRELGHIPDFDSKHAKITSIKLLDNEGKTLSETAYDISLESERDLKIHLYKGAETAETLEVRFESQGRYTFSKEESEAWNKGATFTCEDVKTKKDLKTGKKLILEGDYEKLESTRKQIHIHTLNVAIKGEAKVGLQEKPKND